VDSTPYVPSHINFLFLTYLHLLLFTYYENIPYQGMETMQVVLFSPVMWIYKYRTGIIDDFDLLFNPGLSG